MALQTFKAEFFKALAHPIRIRILEVLRGGERSVQELQGADPLVGDLLDVARKIFDRHLAGTQGMLRGAIVPGGVAGPITKTDLGDVASWSSGSSSTSRRSRACRWPTRWYSSACRAPGA